MFAPRRDGGSSSESWRRSGRRDDADLLGHRLGLGLVLVRDIELDRARRTVRDILVAVNGAARDIDELADLEHARRLALDREGDFALLHRPPLVAWMAMEL